MQSLWNASQLRRSGRNRAAGSRGSNLEDEEFVNAPGPRRKAGYPNTYAASEGVSADQGDTHDADQGDIRFAELDGEALAQAIDDQVEQEVASSPVVVSLSLAVDCSSQAISSLQAVHASFREASIQQTTPSESSLSSPENTSSGAESALPASAQPSAELVQKLQELQSQLEGLAEKHDRAVQALAEAKCEVRQDARASLSRALSSMPKDSLPKGNIRRWLVATSHEDHMASLARNTRTDGSPPRQRVSLSTPSERPEGPMYKFVERLMCQVNGMLGLLRLARRL